MGQFFGRKMFGAVRLGPAETFKPFRPVTVMICRKEWLLCVPPETTLPRLVQPDIPCVKWLIPGDPTEALILNISRQLVQRIERRVDLRRAIASI